MKKKIVLWGENENDKKILIALELVAEESKVDIYSFPEEIATEAFYKDLMDVWRENKEVTFPEGHTLLSRPLSITDELLPETIKVERTDLIARAKTEWHFAILSAKLYEMYKSELEEFKDRLSKLINFDQGLWDEVKGFWTKVQDQSREKNLFREHVTELKNDTNKLFDSLKEKRSILNEEFKKSSKEVTIKFNTKMDEIDGKLEKGLGLKPLFEELKVLQKELWNEKMTQGDRKTIWGRIDGAFKIIKEKRFGDKAQNQSNSTNRLDSRYKGLINAINKMEQSIKRDKDDLAFQAKRIRNTDGQLEQQIRQAKTKMIEERINSKELKLKEIMDTKVSLEQKMQREKGQAEAAAKKAAEKKDIAAAKKEIKAKIAEKIQTDSVERAEETEKLKKAADAIKEAKGKKKEAPKKKDAAVAGAVIAGAIVSDAVKKDDVVEENTTEIKAEDSDTKIAETKSADNKDSDIKAEVKSDEKETVEPKATETAEEENVFETIADNVEHTVTDMVDTVRAVTQVVGDKIEETVDNVKKDFNDDKAKEAGTGLGGKLAAGAAILGSIAAAASDKIEDAVEKVLEVSEDVEEKIEGKVDEIKESIADAKEEAKKDDTAEEITHENVEEKVKEAGGGLGAKIAAGAAVIGAITAAASDKLDDVVDKVKDVTESAKNESSSDDTSDKGFLGTLAAAATDTLDDAINKVKEISDTIEDKVESITGITDEEE